MADTPLKEYLGDGVYADYLKDEDVLVLTAENGIVATETIYLDDQTRAALARFLTRVIEDG